MTKEQKALKLALEALESFQEISDFTPAQAVHAITAIKEALAQPILCKYGNDVQSCTSSPMDCQCCHDALTDMADEEEDLYRLAEKADNGGQP